MSATIQTLLFKVGELVSGSMFRPVTIDTKDRATKKPTGTKTYTVESAAYVGETDGMQVFQAAIRQTTLANDGTANRDVLAIAPVFCNVIGVNFAEKTVTLEQDNLRGALVPIKLHNALAKATSALSAALPTDAK